MTALGLFLASFIAGQIQPNYSLPARTNVYFFAATCYNAIGLESGYSTECVFTNRQGGTNHFCHTVTLAWDKSLDTNVTGYRVYQGGVSKTYTNLTDVGNKTNLTVVLIPPPKPTVITVAGTNVSWAPTVMGPWAFLQPTNQTSYSFTNPTDTRYFRGKGRVTIKRL